MECKAGTHSTQSNPLNDAPPSAPTLRAASILSSTTSGLKDDFHLMGIGLPGSCNSLSALAITSRYCPPAPCALTPAHAPCVSQRI
jgi:hypothetical protein